VIRIWSLILVLAGMASAADRRTAARSEPRDQARAQRGRTAPNVRSSASRREFQRLKACPSTGKAAGACPGYVVDHIIPLKRGGLDAPSNMQWQTIAESTPRQVLEHTESTARQYALRKRAVALGWQDDQVITIDSDLGQSGASSVDREGFQKGSVANKNGGGLIG
jgi:hypothetical protein